MKKDQIVDAIGKIESNSEVELLRYIAEDSADADLVAAIKAANPDVDLHELMVAAQLIDEVVDKTYNFLFKNLK